MTSAKFISAVEQALLFMSRFADGSRPVLRFCSGYTHLHIDFPASDDGERVRQMLEDVLTASEMRDVFVDFSLATFKHTLTFFTPVSLSAAAIAHITSGEIFKTCLVQGSF